MATQKPIHQRSPLEQLPLELWLQICSHLDYFHLKKLHLVSKSFLQLLTSPDLDEALFRCAPGHRARRSAVPRVHPFLAKLGSFIDHDLAEELSIITIRAQHSTKSWRLMDSSLVNEPAVLPPSASIRLCLLPGYTSSLVHSAQGQSTRSRDGAQKMSIVTVGDMLASMIDVHRPRNIWHNVGCMSLTCMFVGWDLSHHAGQIDDTDYEGVITLHATYDNCTWSRA